MGNWNSLPTEFLESEKRTWLDHQLKYDVKVRDVNRDVLLQHFPLNAKVGLGFQQCKGIVDYKHYFVACRETKSILEFGVPSQERSQAKVQINTQWRTFTYEGPEYTVNDKLHTRVGHVLGLCNYSLCMRNSEHVARYILSGKWYSYQMAQERGGILQRFEPYMKTQDLQLVNTFPSQLQPIVVEDAKVSYSFWDEKTSPLQTETWQVSNIEYFLDKTEDTRNIIVFGPTGSGKSRLINLLFNQDVVRSELSLDSVTNDVFFLRGTGRVSVRQGSSLEKVDSSIIVADTVGLCDTSLSHKQLISLLQQRIHNNVKNVHMVLIVFSANRLVADYKEQLHSVLDWMDYKKNPRNICFVLTFCDGATPERRAQLIKRAAEVFELKSLKLTTVANHQGRRYQRTKKELPCFCVGFPQEDQMSESAKESATADFRALRLWISSNVREMVLEPPSSSCTIL